ncbi:Hypothetical protein GLP15_225 [Giardia lamblia P15]|uniref:Uncharacterized protein n=1 Tax=Giardia intestinalis (strain P15) TaxID=658858 RepID=E1F1J6_GIAIA|nr:Hypothetical protein GLP15_225 [Giardia lamblia P15]
MVQRPLVFSVYLEARYLGVSTSEDFERLVQLFLMMETEGDDILQFAEATRQLSSEESTELHKQSGQELRLSDLTSMLEAVDDEILLRLVTTLWSATVYRLVDDPQLWKDAFSDLLLVLGLYPSGRVQKLFITQDEIVLLLLSILKPQEADSAESLRKIAAKELSKMKCRRGCLSLSHFISYLTQQGIDGRALMGTVCILRNMSSGVSFTDCVTKALQNLGVDEDEGDAILQTVLCSPKFQELKYGAPIDSDLTAQMTALYLSDYGFQREEGDIEDPRRNQIEMIFEHTNMLYLQNLEGFLHKLNSNEVGIQDQYLTKIVAPDPIAGMRWEDLNIDELIMQADWVELPLGGKTE